MRKSRNEIDKESVDMLQPIDVTIFGTKDDPCFGKLYDITAEECKICGDCELCSIVNAQNLKKQRLKIEANTILKDMEPFDPEPGSELEIKRYILKKKDRGLKVSVIASKVAHRYEMDIDEALELTKKIIKE